LRELLVLGFPGAGARPSHLGQVAVQAVRSVDFHEIVDQAWS
jgi:hypothetical protein